MRRLLTVLAFVLLALPAAAQSLPPAPPTVAEAVRLSNDIAYGYEKNTVAYWETLPYRNDPEYFFKRMVGWQAEGGPDQAVYGLYAVPPSPWRTLAPPPVVTPPVTPPAPLPAVDLTPILLQLQTLDARLTNLAGRVEEVNLQVQQGRTENRTFFESVRGEWKRILTYAAPIVGAILLGRGTK